MLGIWRRLTGAWNALVVLLMAAEVCGHGRLVQPVSRSSMFRYGFPSAPVNYADNQLFCGGFQRQWEKNGGKCGVCGDPWDGPRENEAGGKYATGTIVRRYRPDSVILVRVELTASHKGWFEFRLCPNNNPHRAVTHDCLDKHVLQLADGNSGTRYEVESSGPPMISLAVLLPQGLTCSQCVLQWKYNAGNSWGEGADGQECVGCGHQEQFYGCSDIAIGEFKKYDADYYSWNRTPRTFPCLPISIFFSLLMYLLFKES